MKIKIGLIGCGRISKNHIEAIQTNEKLILTSVCDIIEQKAKEYATRYNVNYYTDYIKMLEKEKLDLVSICTPSGLHPEIGIAVAKRGINVLTEKPIGIDLKKIDELINTCNKNNVKLFVVKQNRLNMTMQLLKKAVDKKRFGKIFLINSTVRWNRTQDYYNSAPWRGTKELDGGAFMNQASHYIDAVQWLGGRVISVSGITKTLNHNIEMEDSGVAVLEFENGAIGNIEVTMCTYRKNWEGSISIIGETGTAKIGGIAVNKIEYWDFEKYEEEDKFIMQHNYEPPNVYGFGHQEYYNRVAKSLLGNAKIEVDGIEARKSVEIIKALYESSSTGKKIHL